MKLTLITLFLVAVSFSQALGQTPAPITNNTPAGAAPVSMSKSTNPKQTFTDSQIVDIVQTANTADINGGKLAQTKATRDDVKNFAAEMIKDHSDANGKLATVMKTNHIRKQPNDNSKGMQKMAAVTAKHLQGVTAADFDREYIDAELTMHKEVLTSLDDDLIPNAQNADLKNLLNDARTMVADHLAKAKAIHTAMTSGTSKSAKGADTSGHE